MARSDSGVPAAARRAIQAAFIRAYRRTYGREPARSPARTYRLLWREAGGDLGEILARIEVGIRLAHARGIPATLETIFCRWTYLRPARRAA